MEFVMMHYLEVLAAEIFGYLGSGKKMECKEKWNRHKNIILQFVPLSLYSVLSRM